MQLPYLEKNIHAMEQFGRRYPNMREIIEDGGYSALRELHKCGFGCAKCGGCVTTGNVKYFGFNAKTYCHGCQQNNNVLP